MPGFVIQGPNGTIGGEAGTWPSPDERVEYHYTYTWEINGLFISQNIGVNQSPIINLKDLTLPTFSVQTDSYTGASLEYKWAKGVNWEDVKVTWYDTKGMIDVLKEWRQTVWDPITGLQAGSSYKRRSELAVHLPTWDERDSVRWRLYNSWPRIIKHGDLTYTNSDVKLVEVTIAYDWADENLAE